MAVRASNSITVYDQTDVLRVTTFWQRAASTANPPAAPTTTETSAAVTGWSTSMPAFGSQYRCYRVERSERGDGSCAWGAVTEDQSWAGASAASGTAADALSTAGDALAGAVEYVAGTQTASTNAWTGRTRDASLATGKTIAYRLPYAGTSSAATLNLTLSGGGTTGAKALRRNSSTVTTQFAAGTVLHMTYDGTYWRITGLGSDTNYYDRTAYKASVTASGAIAAGRLAAFGADGKLALLGSGPVDVTRPVLYVGTAYAAGALTQTNNYTFWGTAFALTNTHAVSGAAAGLPVYLVGTLEGTTLAPTADVLTCSVPTEEDGLCYMRLGLMSTAANAVLEAEHPLFAFREGSFRRMDAGALLAAVSAASAVADLDEGIGAQVNDVKAAIANVGSWAGVDFDAWTDTDTLTGSIKEWVTGTYEGSNGLFTQWERRINSLETSTSGVTAEFTTQRFDSVSSRLEELTAWLRADSDASGTPRLRLGNGQTEFWSQLTNEELAFMVGTQEVASVGSGGLSVPRASVTEQLGMGGWAWVPREGGNLSLKWIGG